MKKTVLLLVSALVIVSIIFSVQYSVVAKEPDYPSTNKYPKAKVYEIDPEKPYKSSKETKISGETEYGEETIGTLMVSGSVFDETKYDSKTAYCVNGDIDLNYIYSSNYEIKESLVDWVDNEDTWFMVSDDVKSVDGNDAKGKIKSGCVMVLSSKDGKEYSVVDKPRRDYFADSSSTTKLCSFASEDLKNGLYVRVLVAYHMKLRTKDNYFQDEYKEYRYLEKYDFYLSYEKYPIYIRDMDNRISLSDNSRVKHGFTVDFSGYSGKVRVKKPSGTEVTGVDSQSFYEPGKYTITVQTSMGTDMSQTVEVTKGLKFTEVTPVVHEIEDNEGYVESEDNKLKTGKNTVFGTKSHTKIRIGSESTINEKSEMKAYGVTEDDLYIYLAYCQNETDSYKGWTFNSDEWGKVQGETVTSSKNVVGEIGSGAIIVKTSNDGKNWTDMSKGSLANGIYNSDVSNSYGTAGNLAIYMPSGKEIVEGKYYQIIYMYEVKNNSSVKNYLEKYEFYICYNDLDAITFHNLTVTDEIMNSYLDSDTQSDVEIYKMSETMKNNDYTTTGFKLDDEIEVDGKTVAFNAKIYIKKDDQKIEIPSNKTFTEDGRYDISMISALGTKKDVTIYVDKRSNEEVMKYYFGDSFIDGNSKRILPFNEDFLSTYEDGLTYYTLNDMYPTYEGGYTYYNLNEIDDFHKPLTGSITNKTTGKVISIDGFEKTHALLKEPGEYYAEFTTESLYNIEKSGDSRTFRFNFRIIDEGTAPGPVVNQNNLYLFSNMDISSAKLVYYGITIPTAGAGNVIYMFGSYDDAYNTSVTLERNNIVKTDTPTGLKYVYAPICKPEIKNDYKTIEEAEEWADYYAKEAVEYRYIDFTDSSTYSTLKLKEIPYDIQGIKKLNISHDVYLFYENQREKMIDSESLPIINDKRCSYVDTEGYPIKEENQYPFLFIRDKYGIDSNNVYISDYNGRNTIEIKYGKSVQDQLKAAGYSTGIIRIKEKTIYGDEATYLAYYVAPEENKTTYTIVYQIDGTEYRLDVSQDSIPDYVIEADNFYLENISDEIDPYGLVKVTQSNGDEFFCMPSDGMENRWTLPGEYTISCINRLGYSYSYTLRVLNSDEVVVSFVDDDMVVIDSYVLEVGDTDIELPNYERKGYTLDGFVNLDTSEEYRGTLGTINESGQIYLKPIWIPDTVNLYYFNEYNQELQSVEVEFGNTYDLNDYDPIKDMKFLGWTVGSCVIVDEIPEDIEILTDTITIDSVDNIYLCPVLLEEPEDEEDEYQETIQESAVDTSESTIPTQLPETSITVQNNDQANGRKTNLGTVIAVALGSVFITSAIFVICIIITKRERNN